MLVGRLWSVASGHGADSKVASTRLRLHATRGTYYVLQWLEWVEQPGMDSGNGARVLEVCKEAGVSGLSLLLLWYALAFLPTIALGEFIKHRLPTYQGSCLSRCTSIC